MAGIVRRFFIALVWLLTAAIPATASQVDPEWTILDVSTLPLPTRPPDHAFSYLLSPDAAQLAWVEAEQKQMCLMDIASQVKRCRPIPSQYFDLALLNWSPDGQYIALRDGFGEFSEHLVYELETDTYHEIEIEYDLTIWSDMYWDPSMTPDTAAEPVIYYMTYEGTDYTVLRKHWVLTGEQEIFDQRTVFDAPLILYTALPISLDGTRFVFSIDEGSGPSEYEKGLWAVDITTLDVEQVASVDAFRMNLMLKDLEYSSSFEELIWDRESNRLVVQFGVNWMPGTYALTSIDLETGDQTPLLALEDVLALTDDSIFYQSYLTTDGQFFFYLDWENQLGKSTVFALPLGTSEREPLVVTEDYAPGCPSPVLLVTIGHDDSGEERRYLYQPHGTCP